MQNYLRDLLCGHLPLKIEQYSVVLVVGGNNLVYEDDQGSPEESMLEMKLLLNSIISYAQQGSILMICDLEYFFLATKMLQPEYMKIHIHFFPQYIIEKYNSMNKASYGYVYIKTKKVMY